MAGKWVSADGCKFSSFDFPNSSSTLILHLSSTHTVCFKHLGRYGISLRRSRFRALYLQKPRPARHNHPSSTDLAAARSAMDASEVDKLNPKDKAELLQFVNHETQRSKVQMQTHQLTETCWNKCVKSVNGSSLDATEAGCLANCVDRFMDVNNLTMKHLSSLRRS
ncbi:mitochondrial import inner membrane translocase subunit TIM8 [Magnaporthiopsis poae ATCC 64411]|uniref:Mitochondrial import inner membrane translocase subunit TIM8 n=1 Tax=Magnaporthiopsis poae (strain ATCC 64411 / 73-15) TaxID=644358 RepID=A0A0C4E3A3_MAGP6|nr:mitochondrial import inner membrane translocase subunit TIM8 [Magnaporthiopsis poae ATCC 64411]